MSRMHLSRPTRLRDRVMDGNDRGVAAVEYGLMVALISIGVMGAVMGVSGKIVSTFAQLAGAL